MSQLNQPKALIGKPISEASVNYLSQVSAPTKAVTLDDMLKDFETFKIYNSLGALDSEESVGSMIYQGGKMFVQDTGAWLSSIPQRFLSNFGNKEERAKGAATQMQLYGNIKLNYDALLSGVKRLGLKGAAPVAKLMGQDESQVDEIDLQSSYEFWRDVNEIEKRRANLAAEMAADDSFLLGGSLDPEVRELITSGKVKPDEKVAMGGSMWADPINYIPFGAAYTSVKGGTNLAFRGAEKALINETKDMITLRAMLQQQVRSGAGASGRGVFGKLPTNQTSQRIATLNQMIKENGGKIAQLAPKRDVALATVSRQLPAGHPLKTTIDDALEGLTVKGKTSKAAAAAGGLGVITGKLIENAGKGLKFLETLPIETATNIMIKMGIPEEKAVNFFQSGLIRKASVLGGTYALVDYFTDDELLALGASGVTVGLPMLARYGRDLSIAGRQMMLAETTLPYFKRLGSQGAETLTEKLVDRQTFFPIRSTAEKVFGAAEGKLAERALVPAGKLTPESQAVVDFLNTSKLGRNIEQAGRIAQGVGTGGAVGGAFGFAASGGGDMEEAFYGGVGAGGAIGAFGGAAASIGRLRGFRSPAEVTQARYGDYLFFKDNLLPSGQKEAFEALPRETQIAYASSQLSYPDVQFNFTRNGKNSDSGSQYVIDGQSTIDVNTDSPRAIEPLLAHEITHHLDRVGGVLPFNDYLIGNALTETPGIYSAKDKDGNYIKEGEANNPNNPLRYKPNEKFERRRQEYGEKRGLTEQQIKDAMTDEITVREIVAEHGTDFFLNDQRRYRDLHEGPIGAIIRGLVESPILNNSTFLRNFIGKLGGTFREDGHLLSPNALFSKMERIPGVTELIRKYNRQIEGLSPEQRGKKFPIQDDKQIIKVTGAQLSKNPELVDLIRGGTILKIDENGKVVADLAMTAREANKYNREFSEALRNSIQKKDQEEGLPEGHVKETQDAAGKTTISGRFLSDSVLDTLEASGNWNKEQIATLRKLNNSMSYNKSGNEFLIHYFKASSKRTGRRYVNASVESMVEVPYGIEITKKGNIIIRTVSVDQLVKNVDKLVKQQKAEVSRLYGPDLDAATTAIIRDIDIYHKNHANNQPGQTGLDSNPQIAEAKKNLINSAFGRTRKEQLDTNPWLGSLGKKEPRPVYRSRRIERIGKVDQLSGERFVDPDKVARNFLPAETTPIKRNKIDIRDEYLAMPKKDEGDAFARPLEEILERIPAEERFIGQKGPGQPALRPNGRPFLEADLGSKIGPLYIKQNNIDQFFKEAIQESGPAAAEAIRVMSEGEDGSVMTPPDETHWKGVEKLPNRDRFWYEISSEAMGISFPDHVGAEKKMVSDMTSATSPLADPNYNAALMISIMSEAARNEPSTTPAVVQKSVADAFSGEFGKQEARKVGSFSQTFKYLMGLEDSPPLSTNDRQVAASFNIPDAAFGKYPVLYEVVARFYNKLRDHTNTERGKRNQLKEGPFQAFQMQAGSWVQKRAETKLANRKKITEEEAFEGDAYASAFKKAAERLRAAGLDVKKDPGTGLPLFTKEILKDPRVTEVLSPLAIQFRQDQFGTMEIVTLLHESGKEFADLMDQSTRVGSKLNLQKGDNLVRRHLKKLMERTGEGKNKQPSLITKLFRLMADSADEITRIELGYGTFEGAMSRNLRIPMGKIPEQYREAFLAILGNEYKQAAQAASNFSKTDSQNPNTYSVFIKGLRDDNPVIKTFAESLSGIGHEANISQRPNGLVLDINPMFLEDFSTQAPDLKILNKLLDRTFSGYDIQVAGRDYDSIYIEKDGYRDAIETFKKDKKNEYIRRIQEATGVKKGLAENYLRGTRPELQAEKASVQRRVEKIRTAYDKHIRERQSVVRQIREAAKQLEAETKKLNPDLKKRIERQEKLNIKQAQKVSRFQSEPISIRERRPQIPDNPLMMPSPSGSRLPPVMPAQNRFMMDVPLLPFAMKPTASKAGVSRDLLERFRN